MVSGTTSHLVAGLAIDFLNTKAHTMAFMPDSALNGAIYSKH